MRMRSFVIGVVALVVGGSLLGYLPLDPIWGFVLLVSVGEGAAPVARVKRVLEHERHYKSYCILHLLERDWAIQPITILDGDWLLFWNNCHVHYIRCLPLHNHGRGGSV